MTEEFPFSLRFCSLSSQLGLTENLDKKWRTFKESFYPDHGGKFRFVPSQVAIRSGQDHMAWKSQYSPYPVQVNTPMLQFRSQLQEIKSY